MRTPRSLLLMLTLGVGLLAPAISQARVHVDVSLGFAPGYVAPPPVIVPPPVVVRAPAPTYYVEEPYAFVPPPGYLPPPPRYHHWHEDWHRDDRWRDDRGKHHGHRHW